MLKRLTQFLGGFALALTLAFTTGAYSGVFQTYGGNAPGICFGGMCLSAYSGNPDTNVEGVSAGHWCFDIATGTAYEFNGTPGTKSGWEVITSGGGGGGGGDITEVWNTLTGAVTNLVAGAGDTFNATGADSSAPCAQGTTLPATCTEGQCFRDSDSGGSETYFCTATNTWSKLVDVSTDDDVPEVGDFGALNPAACPSDQWVTDVTSGALVCTQPAFTNITGTASDAQLPSGITRDTEWDTADEINNALTGVKFVKGPTSSTAGALPSFDGTGGDSVATSGCFSLNGQVWCNNQNDLGQPNSDGFYENCNQSASCGSACESSGYCFVDFNSACGQIDLHICFGNTDLSGGAIVDTNNVNIALAQVLRGTANGKGVYLQDVFDVRIFGARGDGTTDDTQAIRDAIWEACKSTGPAKVYFPGTAHYYRITDRLPVYSESTVSTPSGSSPSGMVSGCLADNDPLPCCEGKNIGYCGVEPYRCDGITFYGDGPKKTRIVQEFPDTSTNTRPVFDVRAADHITIMDMSLEGSGAKVACPSSSNSAIDQTTLCREYNAGAYLVDGTDDFTFYNVWFVNLHSNARLRGYTDNVSITRNFRAYKTRAKKTTYGYNGGDNQDGFTVIDYKGNIQSPEDNSPKCMYMSADWGTIDHAHIEDVYCGDWDGSGIGCNPSDTGIKAAGFGLRTFDHSYFNNLTAEGCSVGGEFNVLSAATQNYDYQGVKNTTIRNVFSYGGTGCYGLGNNSYNVDFGPMVCEVVDNIDPDNDCVSNGNPTACCDGFHSGPTCGNASQLQLGNGVFVMDKISVHDIKIKGARYSNGLAYVHVPSTQIINNLTVQNVDVDSTTQAGVFHRPAVFLEGRGLNNVVRSVRQIPQTTNSVPIRVASTAGLQAFIDSIDLPGFDDSNLPNGASVQNGSQVMCWDCAVAAGTGICTTSNLRSNTVARFDGQNWICGERYSSLRYDSVQFDAGGLRVDGTHCQAPVATQINGGPTTYQVTCDNSTSGVIEGKFQLPPTAYGGPVNFTLNAVDITASPSGIFGMNFNCQCRRPGAAIDSSFSGVQSANIDFTGTTRYAPSSGTRTGHTCNGTCAAGDLLYWKGQVNASHTTSDTVLLQGVKVDFLVYKAGSQAPVPTPTATATVTITPTPTVTRTVTPTPSATPSQTPATPLPTP